LVVSCVGSFEELDGVQVPSPQPATPIVVNAAASACKIVIGNFIAWLLLNNNNGSAIIVGRQKCLPMRIHNYKLHLFIRRDTHPFGFLLLPL
jgi:hypothetical protein